MEEFLAAAKLGHLTAVLSAETLETCAARLAEVGRPGFISYLKEIGVEKLSERQKMATLVAKAAKAGGDAATVVVAATASKKLPFRSMLNLDLCREFEMVVEDPNWNGFLKRVAPLQRLGDSDLLPGEVIGSELPRNADPRKPEAKLRLIALYGSGYDASAFDAWKQQAPEWLELRVLELPGHGTREIEGLWGIGTPCFADDALSDEEIACKIHVEREEFIRSLADAILPLTTLKTATAAEAAQPAPYALYGFSSGAFFSYLLSLELMRRQATLPVRVFASGRGAPHCVWAPSTIRLYRCASEEEMEKILFTGLGVPTVKSTVEARLKAQEMQAHKANAGVDEATADELVVAAAPAAAAELVPVQAEAPAADEDFGGVTAEAVARKNASWRAPLLTSAVCVGKRPASGPYFGATDEEGGRLGAGKIPLGDTAALAAAVANVQHAPDAPKLNVPLVVLASSNDRVWPDGLPQRWEEVVNKEAGFKFVTVGALSHFKMMVSDEVRKAVTMELAAAAAAQASSLAD